jgi:adenylate kinase family enzyme
MSKNKILVIGASGTGTSTVSAMLSKALQFPHIDLDDIFWVQTDPPFTHFRDKKALAEHMATQVYALDNWIISGDATQWGVDLAQHINLAIFLNAPTEIRVKRLQQRETERHGDELLESGKMYQIHQDFLAWTKRYDTGGITGRTRERQEMFLGGLTCPVIKIEATEPPEQLAASILGHLGS